MEFSQLNDEIGKKTEYFLSPINDRTQTFNVGAAGSNRCYLFSAGWATRNTLEFISIASTGAISHASIVNTDLSITAISYASGVVTVTLSEHPYCQARLTRLS